MSVPDRIEKNVVLAAPIAQVWRAIANAEDFGAWFGAAFDGPFVVGAPANGTVQPTTVDPAVAALQAPHAGKPFQITIDRIEPSHLFSFLWHPFAIDPTVDYSAESMTLVTLELSASDTGTILVITESGFVAVPEARRTAAYNANANGWDHQTRLLAAYLDSRATP
jgi:uncharacterized protein YndB with AHSA1/START domain